MAPTSSIGVVPAQSMNRYLPALDGVRFFSCAAVVLFHCFVDPRITATGEHLVLRTWLAQLGGTGVDVFFSLSGFLITRLLLTERAQQGRVDLAAFYVRRTLRIWPAYYLALILGLVGILSLGQRYCRPFGVTCTASMLHSGLAAQLFFLGNWYHGAVPDSLAPLWSVCVEEQFYLLFPITFVFSRRHAPVLAPVLVGTVLAYSLRAWLAHDSSAIYTNTFAHSDNLLLGALLAQWMHLRPEQAGRYFRQLGAGGEILAVGGLVAFNFWDRFHLTSAVECIAYYAVSAIATTLLVGVFACAGGPIARFCSRRELRFLGQLTYTGYVFHPYAIVVSWTIVRHLLLGPWAAGFARAALAVPLSMAIGYGCRITFERRFMQLKRLWTRVSPATEAVLRTSNTDSPEK